MSQQSDKAKWDALAEMLGATVSQPEGPPPPRQESTVAPRIQLDLPPSPRKKADWDSLANDLGAQAKHRSERPAATDPSSPKETESTNDEEPSVEENPSGEYFERDVDEEEVVGDAGEALDSSARDVSAAGSATLETHAGESRVGGDVPDADRSPGPVGDRSPPRRRRRRGQQRPKEETAAERGFREDTERDVDVEQPSRPAGERRQSEHRDPGGGSKRAGHKSVPSWSEAIAVLIDSNLAGRSTRRRPGPNGGRPRGRRGGKRS